MERGASAVVKCHDMFFLICISTLEIKRDDGSWIISRREYKKWKWHSAHLDHMSGYYLWLRFWPMHHRQCTREFLRCLDCVSPWFIETSTSVKTYLENLQNKCPNASPDYLLRVARVVTFTYVCQRHRVFTIAAFSAIARQIGRQLGKDPIILFCHWRWESGPWSLANLERAQPSFGLNTFSATLVTRQGGLVSSLAKYAVKRNETSSWYTLHKHSCHENASAYMTIYGAHVHSNISKKCLQIVVPLWVPLVPSHV